jgi:electron transfer flavoprotein beta subunit
MTPESRIAPLSIAVCLKWVDQRVDADALLHADAPDERFAGVSASDQAALEWALRCRDSWDAAEVVAITVGPAQAEAVLRDAMAAGADRAVRVEMPFGAPSRSVASELASVTAASHIIWCGDASFDRGTGSVPAFLAGELEIAQALGLVAVELPSAGGATIIALRRLDGGRRERLSIDGRAVISVEGSTAMLRRAPLRGLLSKPPIEIVAAATPAQPAHVHDARPYRPRARTFAAPTGTTALERIKVLTSAGSAPATHGDSVSLDPPAAADRILAALTEWGYLS